MQDYLALSIFAVAAAYLVWRGWKFFAARKKSKACGSACGGCEKNDSLVAVEVHAISLQSSGRDTTSPAAR
jgi:hypothetical protein